MRFNRLILMAVLWVLLLHPAVHAMEGHGHDLGQHQATECLLCHIPIVDAPPSLISEASLTGQAEIVEASRPAWPRLPLQTRGRSPPATLLS